MSKKDKRWKNMSDWWEYGYRQGWVDAEAFCWVHGEPEVTEVEVELYEDDEICIPCVRLYPHPEENPEAVQRTVHSIEEYLKKKAGE